MKITDFPIVGPLLIRPKVRRDDRGYFIETWKDAWFRENVADIGFVQDNQSFSTQKGTVRGLHFQTEPFSQGKLIRCLRGAIFDVAVDVRTGSASFGQWISALLTSQNAEQLWVPEGFLHGFCTLEPDTEVLYKVTAPYSPEHDRGIAFDDPDIGIPWPVEPDKAILSEKDKRLPRLKTLTGA